MSGKARSVELTAGNPQRNGGWQPRVRSLAPYQRMQFVVVRSRGKSGHSEVVSARAETAERQAPYTADGQVATPDSRS